jgi:hypothetical protein
VSSAKTFGRLLAIVLICFLPTGLDAAPPSKNRGADCDLSAVDFPADAFERAMSYFLGNKKPLSQDMQLLDAKLTFDPPTRVPEVEHEVYPINLAMEFDASTVVSKWWKEVKSHEDVGCSSLTIWFPSPAWDVDPAGAWIGKFHVKYVKRGCGVGQIDIATYEIDYWNRIAVQITPDRKQILPVASNGSSDNVSPIMKMLAQGLGAISQIVTFGFVPQADVQAVDGHQEIEKWLKVMYAYEKDLLASQNAPGERDIEDFTLDFLFAGARFSKIGSTPIMVVSSTQNENNLPSHGEACAIREAMQELKTGGQNVGPEGTEYVTQGGDSYWRIARRFYGSAKYQLLVAGENGVDLDHMNKLQTGKKLMLKSLADIRKSSDTILVARRDSLWGISKKQTPPDFERLKKTNRGWLNNPNVIFPLQLVKAPRNSPTQQDVR